MRTSPVLIGIFSADDWYVGRVSMDDHRTFYVYTTQDKRMWSTQIESLAQQLSEIFWSSKTWNGSETMGQRLVT